MNEFQRLAVESSAGLMVAAIAYALLVRRLADLAQPVRLSMAKLGERILSDDSCPERHDQTQFYLDHAFSGWVACAAVVIMPFASLWSLLKVGSPPVRPTSLSQKEDSHMAVLFTISVFAANPLFGTILFFEFFICGLVLTLIRGPQSVLAALYALLRAETSIPNYRTRFAAAVSFG